jgi:outer membrane receptor for ferric coprogen and ferric-rhodotorulic acid
VKTADDKWTDDTYGLSLGSSYQINQVYRVLPRIGYNYTPTPEYWTTVDDADLVAEKRWKYEASLAAAYCEAFNVMLSPFYYDVKNAKVVAATFSVTEADGTENTINVYDNNQSLRRSGLELLLEGKVSQDFDYKVGYTYYTSSSDSEDRGVPDHKYSVRLNYRKNGYEAGISVLSVDPYRSGDHLVGDFTIVNIDLAKTLNRKTKISLYGRNITDEHYATMFKNVKNGYFYNAGAVYGVALQVKL